jgi:hypothetical protein
MGRFHVIEPEKPTEAVEDGSDDGRVFELVAEVRRRTGSTG